MARRLIAALLAPLVGAAIAVTVMTPASAAGPGLAARAVAPAPATSLDTAAQPMAAAQPAAAARPIAAAQPAAAAAVNFAGTVALSNCSGSIVRTASSLDTDPALAMSNGHCLESGFLRPGEVVVNRSSTRSFKLLNAAGTGTVGTVRATKISYATMTDTDVSLYQLGQTYGQIRQQYGIQALQLSSTHPTAGVAIKVVSGYWKRIYSCNIDGFVYRLREGDWTWKDSIRYTSACKTIGGTSGSPVIEVSSGKVVGVNNTGNEDGQRCTLNNPCEVDQSGNVTVRPGINYGQQTFTITSCIGARSVIDLTRPGCTLPRPRQL